MFTGSNNISVALVGLIALAGCAPRAEPGISVIERKDSFAVKIVDPRLSGLCFAPSSILHNGYLSVIGMDKPGSISLRQVNPDYVSDLPEMLEAKRQTIKEGRIETEVPKVNVVQSLFTV